MARREAQYDAYRAVPDYRRAEIINGTLYVTPRSAPRHALARSALLGERRGWQDRGWWILSPEIRLVELEPLQPDYCGWRTSRMPALPNASHIAVPPDWILEVPFTALCKREKLALYAAHRVPHVWWVEPRDRTLEVYTLDDETRWREVRLYEGDARVRAAPFEDIEIELAALWGG